jgi:hypothetical protein
VDAWLVFAVVASVIFVAVVVMAAAIMRAAWAQKEREALTSSDLRAVEESALLLIDQLREEADRSISEIDERRKELSELIVEADARISELKGLAPDVQLPLSKTLADSTAVLARSDSRRRTIDKSEILRMASSGLGPVDIAKATGLDCADVKVALKLGGMARVSGQ